MIDYGDLYDRLTKHYQIGKLNDPLFKNKIINLSKSREHKFNPNKNTKKITYMATVMKSYVYNELNKIRNRRGNRISKIKNIYEIIRS